MPTSVAPDDRILLTNNSSERKSWVVDSREYFAEPGQTIQVPFDLVRIWFGDPRSTVVERLFQDEGGRKYRIPGRDKELKRLDLLYGVEAAQAQIREDAEREGTAIPQMPLVGDIAPDVTVTDIAGNPIKHVIEDPTGREPVSTQTDLSSPESVAAEVARLTAATNAMKERLDAMKEQAPNPDGGQEVTEDGPDQTPKK